MKPLLCVNRDVLVILGGWNANILLNLDWLKKYLFPNEPGLKLELPFGPGMPGLPSISARKVRITLLGAKLSFIPIAPQPDVEDYDYIEELARKVADYLPHTPINAVGVNFAFELESDVEGKSICSSNVQQEIHKVLQDFGTVSEEVHQFSVPAESRTLNFAIRQSADGNRTFDFNFHHPISSLADYKELASDFPISQYKEIAERYLNDLLAATSAESEVQDGNE